MSTKNNSRGVRKVRVDSDRDGQRVDNFLFTQLKGVPKSAVYRLIRKGQVRINGGRCKPASRLREGDEVRIPPVRSGERQAVELPDRVIERLAAAIFFENDDLIVIDKPPGMAVHGGSGLPWGLIDGLRQGRPGQYLELVHRLDRETSGCLAIAKSGAALKHFTAEFREARVDKRYLCLLDGILPEALVDVIAPLVKVPGAERRQVVVREDGREAHTRFRLLQAYRSASYVEAELLTGRTHQIRAHALHIGLPLAGDELYAARDAVKRWKGGGLKRIFLHAHLLELALPSGERQAFSRPLPADLRQVLDRLE